MVTEIPLQDEDRVDHENYLHMGLETIGVSGSEDPSHIVRLLREYLEENRDKINALDHDSDQYADRILELGHVWGEQAVRMYGWEWMYLQFDGGDGGINVLSPNRKVFVNPIKLVMEIVSMPQRANNTALLFNTLSPNILSSQIKGFEAQNYIGLH